MSNSNTPRPVVHRATILAKARKHKADEKVPLLVHATLRWARKIKGDLHYFGPVDAALPDYGAGKAMALYHFQVEDIRAGRPPRLPGETADGATVKRMIDDFLNSKRRLRDNGELSHRTWRALHQTGLLLAKALKPGRLLTDLRPDDFDALRARLAKRLGPLALGDQIAKVRSYFKFAYDQGLIDAPVRYGQSFKPPSKRVLRKHRASNGKRMFDPAEIKALLEKANPQLQAMILLGANCGFGNADVGRLPMKALDLAGGWVTYARGKTGVGRRCKLWPETIAAVRVVLNRRPEPKEKEAEGMVFVTKFGRCWFKDAEGSDVTSEFSKVKKAAGIDKPGVGFYGLRHCTETIGSAAKDQVALDHIMGHADASMAAVYREHIDDERIEAVTDHIHTWLFPKE